MVCFLQCFKIIVVLHRSIFLLSQQGEFMILKRVCGPSLGCSLLSYKICKVDNQELFLTDLHLCPVSDFL